MRIPNPARRARIRLWILCSCTVLSTATESLRLFANESTGPEVAYWQNDAIPGQTYLLFGNNLNNLSSVEWIRVDDAKVIGPEGVPTSHEYNCDHNTFETLHIIQPNSLSAKLRIPKEWNFGIYALRLVSGRSISSWHLLNRPEIWFGVSESGQIAKCGDKLKLVGCNFTDNARVWLMSPTGSSDEVEVLKRERWSVTVRVPGKLKKGVYSVFVHNGFGGKFGFSDPFQIQVSVIDPLRPMIASVQDFGAKGDGVHDDSDAILRAVQNIAKYGGGVVFLPKGTYVVTAKISLPEHVCVRGEGSSKSRIVVPNETSEIDSIFAGAGNFSIEDLAIFSAKSRRIVASPDIPSTYQYARANWDKLQQGKGGVRLRGLLIQHLHYSVRIRGNDPRRSESEGPSTITIKGPACTIESCRIVSSGMPIQLADAGFDIVRQNYLGTGRNGAYGLWGFHDGIFEDNEVTGSDLEGTYGGAQGFIYNAIFQHNFWHDAYGDEREALSFDGPYNPYWVGAGIVTLNEFQVQRTSFGSWDTEREVMNGGVALLISGGRGVGQLRTVIGMSGKTAKIDRGFDVSPDSTSIFVLCARKERVIVSENRVSDASVGVQLYTDAYNFIIFGNRMIRTGGSYALATDYYESPNERRFSYAYFNLWTENRFSESLALSGPFSEAVLGTSSGRYENVPNTIPAIGNRIVKNTLDGFCVIGVKTSLGQGKVWRTSMLPPPGRDCIIEENCWLDGPGHIDIESGNELSLCARNTGSLGNVIPDDRGQGTFIDTSDVAPPASNSLP